MRICPYCNHDDAKLFRENCIDSVQTKVDFYRCNECASIYPETRANWEEAKQILKNATVDNEPGDDRFSGNIDKNLMPILARCHGMLSNKTELSALDIGTKYAKTCVALERIGFNASGIEAVQALADQARQKNMDVFCGFFPEDVPQELNKKYNLITALEVTYYFHDLKKGYQKIYDLLADDGIFLSICHQGESKFYSDPTVSLYSRYKDLIQSVPTWESLSYCLRQSGFRVIDMFPFPFSRPTSYLMRLNVNLYKRMVGKIYKIKDCDRIVVVAKKDQ